MQKGPEFEGSNFPGKELRGPSLDIIHNLKSKGLIRDGSPFWWSTDYSPDPRELLQFNQFMARLVHVGTAKVQYSRSFLGREPHEKDVYLYPEPQVPISILSLSYQGANLPFLATARPYHEKEIFNEPISLFLKEHPISNLSDFVLSDGVIDIPDHFFPHIRGLFAGQRNNHFFWYPLRPFDSKLLLATGESDFTPFRELKGNLVKESLSFLDIYEDTYLGQTYNGVWHELMNRPELVDAKGGPKWVDFAFKEVSAEELLEDSSNNGNLLAYYPIRHERFRSTLPIVIANKTHNSSRLRGGQLY